MATYIARKMKVSIKVIVKRSRWPWDSTAPLTNDVGALLGWHFVRLIAKPLLPRLKLEGVESDLIQGPSHNLSHSPAWPGQVRGHGRGEWPTIHELFASV
jgi:hypothetical protein